jgi:hypothetical protein
VIESRSFIYQSGIDYRGPDPHTARDLIACTVAILGISLIELGVRIETEVRVPALANAKSVVEYIFASSGVKIRWTDDPRALGVQILNRRPSNLREDTTGFAVLIPGGVSYAGVSLPAVTDLAEQLDVPPATVLGAAMAHEIGHVLLGRSHSPFGIMSAKLDRAKLRMAMGGTLLFTAEQSIQLRAAVQN